MRLCLCLRPHQEPVSLIPRSETTVYTEALTLCLQTPGCLPPLIWGDFGIGKTTITQSLAAALDWDVEILRPAERGEGALGVVPIPSEDRSVLHYPLPD